MKEKIEQIILEYQDDINMYLESDVPFECYQDDIDLKLNEMKKEILALFE